MVLKPIVPRVIVDAPNPFGDLESPSGILLVLAVILAMVIANLRLASI